MKLIRVCLVCVLLGAVLGFSSCSKKEGTSLPSVKFTTLTGAYSESDSATPVSVLVTLSAPASQDVTVNYTWNSTDTTTFLGGDFTFITPSPITIPAGQTSGSIQIQIIDDTQIDGDDNVSLTLSGTSTNAALDGSTANKDFALTIADNDVIPTTKLQVDLTWHLSNVLSDINGVNLDLYLQDSVVITNNQITDDGKTYNASTAATGFETLFVNTSDPDLVYYIAIPYVSGTSSLTYIFTLNGFNDEYGGQYSFGTYGPADANYVNVEYFGPFTKSGGSFPFTGRVESSSNSKRYKVLRFRVTDFLKK